MKIFFFLLALLISHSSFAVDQRTYIPSKAFLYNQVIKNQIDVTFPKIPTYHYIPSLIEHESCIFLTHKRCWDPTSALRTSRETGIGLGQITKTFRADGSIRFDTLTDMSKAYKLELKELSWDTIHLRPDLQIRTMTIMIRDNYNKLYTVTDPIERLKMSDSAYNSGYGSVIKKRRVCSLTKGCDANRWTGHVGLQCLGNNAVIYGKRSACDINKHHVDDVFNIKLPKYKTFYHF